MYEVARYVTFVSDLLRFLMDASMDCGVEVSCCDSVMHEHAVLA